MSSKRLLIENGRLQKEFRSGIAQGLGCKELKNGEYSDYPLKCDGVPLFHHVEFRTFDTASNLYGISEQNAITINNKDLQNTFRLLRRMRFKRFGMLYTLDEDYVTHRGLWFADGMSFLVSLLSAPTHMYENAHRPDLEWAQVVDISSWQKLTPFQQDRTIAIS